jgi:hypothetical protein
MVRAGVFDAKRELMTSGTSTPSADFYGAVQAGVEAAMKATVRLREAQTGGARHENPVHDAPVSQDENPTALPVTEEGPKP